MTPPARALLGMIAAGVLVGCSAPAEDFVGEWTDAESGGSLELGPDGTAVAVQVRYATNGTDADSCVASTRLVSGEGTWEPLGGREILIVLVDNQGSYPYAQLQLDASGGRLSGPLCDEDVPVFLDFSASTG